MPNQKSLLSYKPKRLRIDMGPMLRRIRNANLAQFDDVEVIFPDNPKFMSSFLSGTNKGGIPRVMKWATTHKMGLLTGIEDSCPHILMNYRTVESLFERVQQLHESDHNEEAIVQYTEHLAHCLSTDRKNCQYAGSMDHASFWINTRWPTSPLLRWFPYDDPASRFPTPRSPERLQQYDSGTHDDLNITIRHPDESAENINSYFENWYGHRTYMVEVKPNDALHERQSLALRNAYNHARVMQAIRQKR